MHEIVNILASPLSLLYKSVAWMQRSLRARRSRSPRDMFVISVDGIAFGGTGKTPMTIHLGKELKALKIPFAVITRGYGSKLEKSGARLKPGVHTAEDAGDEALMMQRNLPGVPIWVGKDRPASLDEAARAGLKVAILDDGFQSTHIHRHLKIMLYNPDQPWSLLRHFPRLMREADLLLTYAPAERKPRMVSQGSYSFRHKGFFNSEGARIDVAEIPLFGFSALGDNRRFKQDLSRFKLVGFTAFPDHHRFSPGDLVALERRAGAAGAQFLVCTEKDFVKIDPEQSTTPALIYAANGVQLSMDLRQYLCCHVPGQDETHI